MADRQTQTHSKSEQESEVERKGAFKKFTNDLKEILLAYKFSNISNSESNGKVVAAQTVDFPLI